MYYKGWFQHVLRLCTFNYLFYFLTSCISFCLIFVVCEGTFFPSLIEEMSSLVGCFNERAKKLCELHLASGFKKYLLRLRGNLQGDHHALIQEGKDLLTYALINSVVVRQVLDQYDKVINYKYLHASHFFDLFPNRSRGG